MKIAEFKFKEKGQRVKWEDLPIMDIHYDEEAFALNTNRYTNEIASVCARLRRLYECVEIRWNFAGSPQGHYRTGSVSRYPK